MPGVDASACFFLVSCNYVRILAEHVFTGHPICYFNPTLPCLYTVTSLLLDNIQCLKKVPVRDRKFVRKPALLSVYITCRFRCRFRDYYWTKICTIARHPIY